MIQDISARAADGRLALTWVAASVFRAITIQVAADIEFTRGLRQFVLPARTGGCSLDCGPGLWYYRVGGLHGQEDEGEIIWGGIYPPVALQPEKVVLPAVRGRLAITGTQAVERGVRLGTNLREPYLAFVDYSKTEGVPASQSKSRYIRDWGKGSVDVAGLVEGAYFFRVATFVDGLDVLPVDSVKVLAEGVGASSGVAAVARPANNTDRAEHAGDKALLRDVSHRPVVRFSSYVDYVKFQAAQAKTRERSRPV
jgi:hypothetical protein